MAEKYGTVPPKFTKEWWDHFWTYYKWHTIVTAVIIITIVSTVYQKVTAPKYDVTLMYAGANVYSEEAAEKIEKKLSPLCADVDENGENSLFFSQLNIDVTNQSNDEYSTAMVTKLQLSLTDDDVYLYIMDKDTAQLCIGDDTQDANFAPLSDWLASDIDDAQKFSANGIDFGVKLDNCAFFNEKDIDFTDQYLFVRYYPRQDQMERQLAGYEAAIDLANQILNN